MPKAASSAATALVTTEDSLKDKKLVKTSYKDTSTSNNKTDACGCGVVVESDCLERLSTNVCKESDEQTILVAH